MPILPSEEEARFSELVARWRDRIAITYRRRTVNTGFKAGNIRDFCERWGSRHEFAVTLDADSFMTADAILRLVRIMQADPRLGILQGLVVGLPSTSAFARIFQFGMRLGMRSYTIGSAWWQADCGPYWGHNAVLRLEPFIAHCQLPVLSGDGEEERHILSHDQIEAALMRAPATTCACCREEDLGWEENPPTLIEFIRRDLRWCQGNMQYWRFLFAAGPQAGQPLSAGARHPDVHRLAGLDRLARRSATLALVRVDDPATIHARRCRQRAARVGARDVVLAEDRERHRRPARAGGSAAHSAAPAASSSISSSKPCTRSSCVRSSGSATRSFSSACCSAARSAGSGRSATITRCP